MSAHRFPHCRLTSHPLCLCLATRLSLSVCSFGSLPRSELRVLELCGGSSSGRFSGLAFLLFVRFFLFSSLLCLFKFLCVHVLVCFVDSSVCVVLPPHSSVVLPFLCLCVSRSFLCAVEEWGVSSPSRSRARRSGRVSSCSDSAPLSTAVRTMGFPSRKRAAVPP